MAFEIAVLISIVFALLVTLPRWRHSRGWDMDRLLLSVSC